MKNIFLICFISIALILGGCGNQNSISVKDTPNQIGSKGQSSASIISYNLTELMEKADIVAQVEISEWLKEMDQPVEMTLFKAKLMKVYKNTQTDNFKEIDLLQDGNSKFTIQNYPLFKNNDKLILFLKKSEDMGLENTFWILGVYSSVIRIVDIDGENYAVKHLGQFRELLKIRDDTMNQRLRGVLAKDYKVEFPNGDKVLPEVYKLKDLESELNKIKSEVEKVEK